jgi:hypothetical protein
MSYAFFDLTVSVFADIGIAESSAIQCQWFIAGMQRVFDRSPGTDKVIRSRVVQRGISRLMSYLINSEELIKSE